MDGIKDNFNEAYQALRNALKELFNNFSISYLLTIPLIFFVVILLLFIYIISPMGIVELLRATISFINRIINLITNKKKDNQTIQFGETSQGCLMGILFLVEFVIVCLFIMNLIFPVDVSNNKLAYTSETTYYYENRIKSESEFFRKYPKDNSFYCPTEIEEFIDSLHSSILNRQLAQTLLLLKGFNFENYRLMTNTYYKKYDDWFIYDLYCLTQPENGTPSFVTVYDIEFILNAIRNKDYVKETWDYNYLIASNLINDLNCTNVDSVVFALQEKLTKENTFDVWDAYKRLCWGSGEIRASESDIWDLRLGFYKDAIDHPLYTETLVQGILSCPAFPERCEISQDDVEMRTKAQKCWSILMDSIIECARYHHISESKITQFTKDVPYFSLDDTSFDNKYTAYEFEDAYNKLVEGIRQ